MPLTRGDRERLAVEIGDFDEAQPSLRRVDLWAGGRWLTCDDNTAYVPQFCASARGTLELLRAGRDLSLPFPGLSLEENHRRLLRLDDGSRERFAFPQYGPTTDNVLGHLFRVGAQLVITLELWHDGHPMVKPAGAVIVVTLAEAELVGVLEWMVAVLQPA